QQRGNSHAYSSSRASDVHWVIRGYGRCTRAVELQGLCRSAGSVHEELRRADLQVRVSDVHEILQEMTHDHHRLIALRRRVSAAASASSQFRNVTIFGRF